MKEKYLKSRKRFAALVLVFVLTLSLVPGNLAQAAQSVMIRLSAQQNNTFLMLPQKMKVYSDKAENYGYTDAEGIVTMLDALVTAHEYVYGDAFTSETAVTYLQVENGSIKKMFAEETTGVGFVVDGVSPHDDNLIESEWGNYYNGYTVSDAPLSNGEDVEYFFYQDTNSYMDNYAWFEKDGQKTTMLELDENESADLSLKGYAAAWYGCSEETTIKSMTQKLENVGICLLDSTGNPLGEGNIGTTDSGGNIRISGLSEGIYYVRANSSSDNPIIVPVCRVIVDKESVVEKQIVSGMQDATDAWSVLEMVKSGNKDKLTNLDVYKSKAEETIATSNKATDIEKEMIVLSALGQDVSAMTVNGECVNAVERLLSCNLTAVNSTIFALCALDSRKYPLPENSEVTRQTLIENLLAAQHEDGGWSFSTKFPSDVDMTSMAVQALAPYYLADDYQSAGVTEAVYTNVKAAVDKAVNLLAEKYQEAGTYGNANSDAMAVMALASIGIDANADKFVKDEKGLYDDLFTYTLDDCSGFYYGSDTLKKNALATEQAFRAMVSYKGFRESGAPYNIYASDALDAETDFDVTEIVLSDKNKTVEEGETFTLSASVLPENASNKAVVWSSSNEGTAMVDQNGVVTAKKAGNAVITVTAMDHAEIKAECTVTVTAKKQVTVPENQKPAEQPPVVVTDDSKKEPSVSSQITPSIHLNYSQLDLQKGKSTKAVKISSSTPENEKIVSAVSSKESVASVKAENGSLEITGKKKGTATITVTSNSGATAVVKITVKSSVKAKKLTLDRKNVTLKKGEKVTLKLTKNPVTATDKIKWSSSNEKVAVVSSKGVVKAKKKGKATITVKSANGKKATCKVTVK